MVVVSPCCELSVYGTQRPQPLRLVDILEMGTLARPPVTARRKWGSTGHHQAAFVARVYPRAQEPCARDVLPPLLPFQMAVSLDNSTSNAGCARGGTSPNTSRHARTAAMQHLYRLPS